MSYPTTRTNLLKPERDLEIFNRSGQAQPLQGKDFVILDSIRGIASLYVAIAHCRGSLWIGGTEYSKLFPSESWNTWEYIMVGTSTMTRLAVEFVIVFFLLSGFSIAHSLSKNKAAIPFYKRRFVRIYPSYIAALAWAGIVYLITKAIFPAWYDGSHQWFSFFRTNQMNDFFNTDVVIKNLFYMPGEGFIAPFWSLTYEVIFYLLAPLLIRNVNLYSGISLVLFVANLVMPQAIADMHLHRYIHNFLFVYNIYFAAGVFLYKNYHTVMRLFEPVSRRLHLLFVIGALMLVYAVNFYMQTESNYSYMVSAVFSFVLIFYFLKYQVKINWLMNVGKYSYTIYITHLASIFLYLAIYWLIFKPENSYILNYFVWMPAVPFCLLMAYWQFQLVEKRTKKILDRLRFSKSSNKG